MGRWGLVVYGLGVVMHCSPPLDVCPPWGKVVIDKDLPSNVVFVHFLQVVIADQEIRCCAHVGPEHGPCGPKIKQGHNDTSLATLTSFIS